MRLSFEIPDEPEIGKRDWIELKIKELQKQYPQGMLYAKALHTCSEDGSKGIVHGRIIHTNSVVSLVLHDNPWRDDKRFSYYAGGSFLHVEGNEFIPKGYVNDSNKKEFLWVESYEVECIEVVYEPMSNKDAAKFLTKVEDL